MTTALNPFYTLPDTVSVLDQYRMGASFAPDPVNDFVWNTTDTDGNITFAAEPNNLEGQTYITPLDTAGQRDGGLLGPATVAPKQIDFNAAIIGSSPMGLRSKLAALRKVLGPRKTVIFEWYDYGQQALLAMQCAPTGNFLPSPPIGSQKGGIACNVQFSLVAGTPWKYFSGATPESILIGMPSGAVSGFSFPVTFPVNFGAGTNPGGSQVATNQGDLNAYPVYTVTGPINTPVISNNTTNKTFTLLANVPSGQTAEIDAQTGVVTPNSYRLSAAAFPLVPGDNAISWRASSGSFNAAASLSVQWRSTME